MASQVLARATRFEHQNHHCMSRLKTNGGMGTKAKKQYSLMTLTNKASVWATTSRSGQIVGGALEKSKVLPYLSILRGST